MKKLIVLATLAAIPAFASADVTISGNIGIAVTNTQKNDNGSFNDMVAHSGNINFAGNEDLGNGLKAIWQISTIIDATNDNVDPNGFGNRETFVGISGEFGRLRAGHLGNPQNSGFGSRANISNQNGSGNGISQNAGTGRLKHSVRYDSPKIGGFEFVVFHQLKEAKDAETKNLGGEVALKKETDPSYATDLGVKYNSDLFGATLTVNQRKNATVKDTTDRHTQFSAGTSFGDLGIYAAYAERRLNTTAGLKKHKGFGISSNYKLDKVTLIGTLWKESDSVTAGVKGDDAIRAVTLGVDYKLSKRTNAGFEFSSQNKTIVGGKVESDDRRLAAAYLNHSF